MKRWVSRHPVPFYFVLAYAISWSVAVPLALQARGIVNPLAAALWHASFNFVTASPDAAGVTAAVTSTLVMVWAIVVMVAGSVGTPRRVYGRSVRASAEDAA